MLCDKEGKRGDREGYRGEYSGDDRGALVTSVVQRDDREAVVWSREMIERP